MQNFSSKVTIKMVHKVAILSTAVQIRHAEQNFQKINIVLKLAIFSAAVSCEVDFVLKPQLVSCGEWESDPDEWSGTMGIRRLLTRLRRANAPR